MRVSVINVAGAGSVVVQIGDWPDKRTCLPAGGQFPVEFGGLADAVVDPIRVHAGRVLQPQGDRERLAGGDGICFRDQSDWDFGGASELCPGGSAAEQDEGDKSGERGGKAVVHESRKC